MNPCVRFLLVLNSENLPCPPSTRTPDLLASRSVSRASRHPQSWWQWAASHQTNYHPQDTLHCNLSTVSVHVRPCSLYLQHIPSSLVSKAATTCVAEHSSRFLMSSSRFHPISLSFASVVRVSTLFSKFQYSTHSAQQGPRRSIHEAQVKC